MSRWNPDQSDQLIGAWDIHKNARKFQWKLTAKYPATTLSYSMVKFTRGNNALSEIWELEASSVEGQSLLQKDKKRDKRKGKIKNDNP